MFPNLISLLFHSRDYGHRAHLRTTSYAAHMALDEFYKKLTEQVDALVESYQGIFGPIDIPFITPDDSVMTPIPTLERHLGILQGTRYHALDKKASSLQNQIDEIEQTYLTTLYKLRFLR